MSQIGIPTLIFIILIGVFLFGPNKLPELGNSLGRTLKEFKLGTKVDDENDENDENDKEKNE